MDTKQLLTDPDANHHPSCSGASTAATKVNGILESVRAGVQGPGGRRVRGRQYFRAFRYFR